MSESIAVVGVDGSPGSTTALQWAAARPSLAARIRPVHSWSYPWWSVAPTPIGAGTAPPAELMDAVGHETVTNAVAGVDPDRLVDAVVREGSISQVLLDEAESVDLLVVGTRGRSVLADRVLGSVSNACVARATVPVVVVTADVTPDRVGERLVVGFDGSEHATAALSWAIAYATHPDDRIEVVTAWDSPVVDEDGALIQDPDQAEERARSQAEAALPASADGGPTITVNPHRGDPRGVLQREGHEADLLIVGARGRNGVAELLLGSVASALAHQPPCPLAVIR